MKYERAIFRPSAEHANPLGVCGFFADVFAVLDARPRAVEVAIDFSEASPCAPVVVDLERGEPVFRQAGRQSVRGSFGGRWLAEHDVPLPLSSGSARLRLEPAAGRRIKVSRREPAWRLLAAGVREMVKSPT